MNTTQHTPTPWHVGRICGHFCGIYAERGAQIADCTSPDFFPEDSKRNAAFIVRAVNSHAALVALAEKADELERQANALSCCRTIAEAKERKLYGKIATAIVEYREARAALEAAKEGTK